MADILLYADTIILLRLDIFITRDVYTRTKILHEIARLSSWSALANTLSTNPTNREPIRANQLAGLAVSAVSQSTHVASCAPHRKPRANEASVDALAWLYKRGSQSREHQSIVPKGTRLWPLNAKPTATVAYPQYILLNKVNVNYITH